MKTHPIPDAALQNHIAILGKTGSGKSNAAKTVAERLLADGRTRICAIDPTGTWWGLRLASDGKQPSPWPIVIFGGEHADLPIAAEHGAAIAETIGTSSTSAIIDTRQMSVGARSRFFTAFAETLIAKNQGELTLIIDEAHLFAPQSGGSGGRDVQRNEMLHAANNLVSLGRGVGLRIILLSQRPAKLHKDSLTQVETLVAMRLIHNLDVDAVKAWIGEWADPAKGKEITTALPGLPKGDAFVWAPELDYLERTHFPLVATFDSGKPLAGRAPPKLKPIDVQAIAARLTEVAAEALASDPIRLKRQVAELQRQLRESTSKVERAPDPAALEAAEKRGYERGVRTAAERVKGLVLVYDPSQQKGATEIQTGDKHPIGDLFATEILGLLSAHSASAKAPEILRDPIPPSALPPAQRAVSSSLPRQTDRPKPPQRSHEGNGRLGAERKPLLTLASAYPGGLTEAQWATIAGFKRTGGTWSTYKSRLRTAGLIEQRGNLWHATEAGVEAVGGAPPAPSTTEERIAMWRAALGGGPGKILDELVARYPSSLSRDELGAATSLEPTGGTFSTYLSRLASNGLIERNGGAIRASDSLFQ